MPTSHIFVVENGVSKKVSKLSRRYQNYKKLLSTAIPNMSSAQDTAVTADTGDTATAGCAYAGASLSDADDFGDKDNDSLLETSHPIGHLWDFLISPDFHRGGRFRRQMIPSLFSTCFVVFTRK